MFNCLAGCVSKFETNSNKIRRPIDAEMIMPWVEIWVGAQKKGCAKGVISVSNCTSKNNSAAISSFSFGVSNGNGVEVDIVDESGGSFDTFFQKVSTGNVEGASTKWTFKFRFGWSSADCKGNEVTYGKDICCPTDRNGIMKSGYMSCIHTSQIQSIKGTFSEGKFKYKITATDITTNMMTTRDFKTQGSEKEPMPVTTAIREMFKAYNVDVDFRRSIGPCQWVEMAFDTRTSLSSNVFGRATQRATTNTLGPSKEWRTGGRNPLQAVVHWLSGCLTEKGKGIVYFWESRDNKKPLLVFMECTIPKCDGGLDSAFHIGTYLVNAGACSPVISFSPHIEYIMDNAFSSPGTSGTAGTSLDGRTFTESDPCLQSKATRSQGSHAPAGIIDDSWFPWFLKDSLLITSKNKLINNRANHVRPGITAELVVQGDPSFDTPMLFRGSYITVVQINPFPIDGNGKNGCEYLVTGCNNDLSNTNWLIQGVHHEIKSGSFRTTLKLMLPAPGFDIDHDAPLGDQPGAPFLPDGLV